MKTLPEAFRPFDARMLHVGDGHWIYVEEVGRRGGRPIAFLHGGPGSGSQHLHRTLFDPARDHIFLIDQRGAGRSHPYLSRDANTTAHLVSDLEAIREHFDIARWLLVGGSWGSTLALAYAQTHPERVSELVLRGIFTVRKSEIDWYYQHGASRIYPDKWERFVAPIAENEQGDLVNAYRRILTGDDRAAQLAAARAWSVWEGETIRLLPDDALSAAHEGDDFALAFARIENHYFVHGGWLEDGQLIREAGRLAAIPGVIVQGRYDMACPAETAWALHRAWPEAKFEMIEGAGHAFNEPGIMDALIRATDGFAG